ncbi:MAG: gliding motility-associated C-terminal domain-containing protein, partial [Bacteroidia bacterium]
YDPDELSTDFPALTPKYYRRIIYSGEADCCVDISPTVSLVMQPAIANNSLSILSQSICEGVPGASDVIGTTPSGGTAVYTYMWEERILPSGPWIFNDSTRKDLLLGSRIFTNSTSFRRIVISGECTDISVDEFVVTVEPKITGNLISILSGVADTIICSGQDPSLITGPEPSGGLGSGSYSYLWEDSTASHDWQSAPLTNSAAGYDPGILTGTTWYRRRAFSGECESTSNTVKITILPVIAGNTVGSDQFVCFGTAPALLDGTTTVGGGDGTYYYLWESDDDIAFASPVTEGTQAGFQPGDLTAPVYYRRTVYSGLSDCCQDISNAISIAINPLPVGVITALQDEAICQGEEISFSLSVTSGAAPYNVVLNDGTADQSLDVTTTGTLVHQLTPAYTTDKTLDYILYSIEDANACLATSLSGSKHVDFYEIPASYAGPADQQCGHDYSLGAEASVGVGTWSWDGPAVIFDDVNNPNSGVTIPGIVGGDEEFVFWWKEVNVLSRCADSASATVHFWMDPTVADAGNDSTLLPFQRDVLLYANQPIFGTGMWTILEGGGNMRTGDGDNPEGSLQGMTDGLNIVEWKISNGICDPSIDQVELFVPAVRLISGFSPNNDGINDFFEIKGLVEWDGDVVDNELIVTDMTGVVLFQEQNYANDWDGRDMRGNPLPSGTYYYFINVFYSKKEQLKGFVVIKRD